MEEYFFGEAHESYDAIVVGTGISGGWAIKELAEKGLKVLVLERGRMVKHVEDYHTMNMDPWDFKHGGKPTREDLAKQEKQNRTGYTTHEASRHWFVNDLEHPYNEKKRFDWMRGYHVGGRSIMWGRHSYRLSDLDFEANLKDGIGVDWPIRYKDLAPWYDYVEKFAGISGEKLGLPQLPDGQFLPPLDLNCLEKHVGETLRSKFKDRVLTPGRVAHLTAGTHAGRALCQYRNRCIRGCPFGAYFSTLSSTLPAAVDTNNITLRPHSIVYEVSYDKDAGKATGVKVIDANTKQTYEFKSKVIFLCASAMASTAILLQSKSDRFPNGMGNDSGELGHNIMDHHLSVGAYGTFDGFEDQYYIGRQPGGFYIPRFRNINAKTQKKDFLRGYGYQGGGSRSNWSETIAELKYGKELKEAIVRPGKWQFGMSGFGEMLPHHDNKVFLDYDKKDKWGLPTLTFDAEFKENELVMRKDMKAQAVEMMEAAGFKDVKDYDKPGGPGLGIHEMGTARMGRDPKTSVLNAFNQIHAAKNVYVTDGAAMTSSGCQNPSLTYMALTARAANHAVEELKKGNI